MDIALDIYYLGQHLCALTMDILVVSPRTAFVSLTTDSLLVSHHGQPDMRRGVLHWQPGNLIVDLDARWTCVRVYRHRSLLNQLVEFPQFPGELGVFTRNSCVVNFKLKVCITCSGFLLWEWYFKEKFIGIDVPINCVECRGIHWTPWVAMA